MPRTHIANTDWKIPTELPVSVNQVLGMVMQRIGGRKLVCHPTR